MSVVWGVACLALCRNTDRRYTQVRDMRLRVHPFKQVFLRLYERSERRVVGAWEVVPVYEKQGVFVCMRKRLKTAVA